MVLNLRRPLECLYWCVYLCGRWHFVRVLARPLALFLRLLLLLPLLLLLLSSLRVPRQLAVYESVWGIEVRWASRELPRVDPDAEGEDVVSIHSSGSPSSSSSPEWVRAERGHQDLCVCQRNVYKNEIKEEDRHDSSIDGGVRLDVGVTQHAL